MATVKLRTIVENDDTPDKDTLLFTEQDLACRNKYCSEVGKIAGTIRTPIEIG